ncbi:hypothetical protein SLA2020_277220 [Shorea laevis]
MGKCGLAVVGGGSSSAAGAAIEDPISLLPNSSEEEYVAEAEWDSGDGEPGKGSPSRYVGGRADGQEGLSAGSSMPSAAGAGVEILGSVQDTMQMNIRLLTFSEIEQLVAKCRRMSGLVMWRLLL